MKIWLKVDGAKTIASVLDQIYRITFLSDNLDLIQGISDLLSESNLVLLFSNFKFSRTNERGI